MDAELRLNYIGMDDWHRPVYKDQNGKLWADVECGDSEVPSLYSLTNNEFDGEPNMPIRKTYVLESKYEKNPDSFSYMILDKLRVDCETHLAKTEEFYTRQIKDENKVSVIAEMKELWLKVKIKPEWLTWEQIEEYESKIIGNK